MTHDPLCTTVLNTEMNEVFCNCDVIARVREDERSKFVSVDTTYMPAEQFDAMMKALDGGKDD